MVALKILILGAAFGASAVVASIESSIAAATHTLVFSNAACQAVKLGKRPKPDADGFVHFIDQNTENIRKAVSNPGNYHCDQMDRRYEEYTTLLSQYTGNVTSKAVACDKRFGNVEARGKMGYAHRELRNAVADLEPFLERKCPAETRQIIARSIQNVRDLDAIIAAYGPLGLNCLL